MEEAIFLNCGGVVNEMIYYPEYGEIDASFTVGHWFDGS